MHSLRQYLKIEGALSRRLMREWRPEFAKLYRDMSEDIAAGDFAAAYDKAGSINFTKVARSTSEYVRFSLHNAAAFGARCATNGGTTMIDLGDHKGLLGKVSKVFALTLQQNVTRQVYGAAIDAIKKAEAHAKAVTKAEAKKRFVRGFVSFKADGDQMLQMVSSLHTSRLAVWGFTAEAMTRGIPTYRLEAVLDGRTSVFCQFINGKTFEVADARQFIVKALNADSPEDLRSLHPWPKQDLDSMDAYKTMTTDELRARGYFVPPFHPHCRTLCVPVGASYPGQSFPLEEGGGPAHFEVTLPEAFEQLGLELDEGNLEHWNKMVGESPAGVLSEISGEKATDLLDGKAEPSVVFNEDGSIGLGVKTDEAQYSAVLDPFDGTVYVNHAEFEDQAPKKAASTVKDLLRRVNKLAQDKGLDMTVSTTGGLGYAMATAGFTPSAAGWKLVKAAVTTKLATMVLTGEQAAAVKLIVHSNDPGGFTALAALPWDYEGQPIGQYLLEDLAINVTLSDGPQQDLFEEWAGE